MLQNTIDGKAFYKASKPADKEWFAKQWKMWPDRADERLTTNLAFHYGGILAYRELNNEEPEISDELSGCIKFLDDRHEK